MRSQRSGVRTMRRREETFSQEARNDSVGGNHEVFDQIRGAVLLLLHDIDDLIVQHKGMHLVGLQVERTVLEALGLELLRDFILKFQLCLQIR